MPIDASMMSIVAAVPLAIVASAAWVSSRRNGAKLDRLHADLNSRLTQLIRASEMVANYAGQAEGRAQAKAEGKADVEIK